MRIRKTNRIIRRQPTASRSSHNANAAFNFDRGEAFENFVCQQLKERRGFELHVFKEKRDQFYRGETLEGYEIKLDTQCTRTGRFSIEYYHRTQLQKNTNQVRLSDIWRMSRNNHSLIIGNYDLMMVFRLDRLYEYQLNTPMQWYEPDRSLCLGRKFLPLQEALTIASDVLIFNDAVALQPQFPSMNVEGYQMSYPKLTHNLPDNVIR